MLASRKGWSRRWWVAAGLALLLATWIVTTGGPSGRGDTAAPAPAASAPASERDAILAPALARVRAVSRAITSLVPGALRLEGVARDGDQQPVAGARVTLGDGARTTTTEADGSFFFDDLSAATYALTAETADQYGEDRDVRLTDDSDPVELLLRRGPTLVVHVVELTGAPIAGARVESNDRSATTDRDGLARLRGVELGHVSVTVTAVGHAPGGDWVQSGDDPAVTLERTVVLAQGSAVTGIVVDARGQRVAGAFIALDDAKEQRHEGLSADEHGGWTLPDVASGTYKVHATSDTHVATPDVVFVHDGARAQDGIVIRVEDGAQLAGSVVDGAGKPVAGARISTSGQSAESDEKGRFVVTGLAPDSYDVCAYTETDGSPTQKVVIMRGAHVEVRLVVRPSSIAGVVVDPHGLPIEDVRVRAQSPDPHGHGYGSTDERGHFDLGGLPPGDYEVMATREGEKDRRASLPLHVTSGNRKVRIVLPELATIRGRVVRDGKPVPYFGFVLADDPTTMSYDTPTPVRDPDGQFRVTGLRAGVRTLAIIGPNFARRDLANVRVGDGETLDLGDLAVEPGRAIHGRVVDARGAAVPGALVAIHEPSRRIDDDALGQRLGGRYVAHADARGAYVIGGIVPGDGDRVIDATTATTRSRERPLAPDETEVEIVVAATGTVAGTVDLAAVAHHLVVATAIGDGETRYYANPDKTGAFEFEPLPVGTYSLRLMGPWTMAARRADVTANAQTTVTFAAVPQLVELAVHWPGCGWVSLQDEATDERLTGELCSEDRMTLPGVVPGRYRLCSGDCIPIDVPAQPVFAIEGPPATD